MKLENLSLGLWEFAGVEFVTLEKRRVNSAPRIGISGSCGVEFQNNEIGASGSRTGGNGDFGMGVYTMWWNFESGFYRSEVRTWELFNPSCGNVACRNTLF